MRNKLVAKWSERFLLGPGHDKKGSTVSNELHLVNHPGNRKPVSLELKI